MNRNEFLSMQNLAKCADFATRVHKDQKRKDEVTPYSVHLGRVATLAASYGVKHRGLMVAWLHDVLEDHPSCRMELEEMLMSLDMIWNDKVYVLAGIANLTKDYNVHPRSERVAKAIKQIRKADEDVIIVKLCDRMDNLATLSKFSRNFIDLYLTETEQLIESLVDEVSACDNAWKALKDLCVVVSILRKG